jgi:2,4-dienoyl-CoA reductase-like NADH-dependent reductase (Old Yellow Enzyme family)
LRTTGIWCNSARGIWDDKHIEPLLRINRFVKSQGAVSGIQLARELLRDSNWPLQAAQALGQTAALEPPIQYARAWSRIR